MNSKTTAFLKRYQEVIILSTLFLINFGTHFFRLSYPREIVFDETYFANFANNYLKGIQFTDIHPPLGKLLIALGIKLFGFNSLGWRITNAFFGILFIFLAYFLIKKLFQSRMIGYFFLFLATFETSFFIESRFALINIYLLFFGILGFYFLAQFFLTQKIKHFLAFVTFSALSFSVKWIGLFGMGIFLVIYFLREFLFLEGVDYFKRKFEHLFKVLKKLKTPSPKWLFLSLIIFIGIYSSIFLIDIYLTKRSLIYFLEFQANSLKYNLTLEASHPYSSHWWSWPLVLKPVWFYYQNLDHKVLGVVELGNVFIWWLSVPAILYLSWQAIKKSNILYFLVSLGFWVSFLPFIFIHRVMFLYHYLTPLMFGMIGESIILKEIFEEDKKVVILLLIAIAGFFIYFYPLLTALPISEGSFVHRMLFKSWY